MVHISFNLPQRLRHLVMRKCTVLKPPAVSRRLSRILASALLALIAVTAVVPASAFADDSDGISGTPADANGPDGRSRLSYQSGPGQHLDDFYTVRNTGTTSQTFTVFATDAFNTDDGAFGLLDTDATPTDAGSWVAFEGGAKQLSVPLEPGGSVTVPFSIDVPADARPGDHAGGIVISSVSPVGEILVDKRVATRLYVRVPGELQPNLTISNISANYLSEVNPFAGAVDVSYTVANNGNVALAANAVVAVSAALGISVGEAVKGEIAELLPGSHRTVHVTVPDVGQLGYLNVSVKLMPAIDAEALNPGPLREVNRDSMLIAMPWLVLGILLVAGLIVLVLRLRNRRDEKNAQLWFEYTEAEARRRATEDAAAERLEKAVK